MSVCVGGQVDASEEPLKNLILSQMLEDLIKDEKEASLQIKMSRKEVSDKCVHGFCKCSCRGTSRPSLRRSASF